jgi:hypothetical protein
VGGYSSQISKKGLMLGSQNNEGFVKGGRDSVSANFFNWWPKGPLELFNGGNSGPLSLSIGGPDTSMSVKGPPISAKN